MYLLLQECAHIGRPQPHLDKNQPPLTANNEANVCVELRSKIATTSKMLAQSTFDYYTTDRGTIFLRRVSITRDYSNKITILDKVQSSDLCGAMKLLFFMSINPRRRVKRTSGSRIGACFRSND